MESQVMQSVMVFAIDLFFFGEITPVSTDFNARLCTCGNTLLISPAQAVQLHNAQIHSHARSFTPARIHKIPFKIQINEL